MLVANLSPLLTGQRQAGQAKGGFLSGIGTCRSSIEAVRSLSAETRVNPRHKKISGGHRKNSVLIAGPLNGWKLRRDAVSPLNIKRTVLEVLSDGGYEAPDMDRLGDSAGLPFLVRA